MTFIIHKSKFLTEYITEIRKMHPKKIIIAGIQASGKGTQAQKIAELLGIQHLSTGEILRKHLDAGSDLVEGYTQEDINAGKLAPIEVIERVMAHELQVSDNFILDGFPRSKQQLELMESAVSDIDMVIYLDVDDLTATERMLSRGRGDDNEAGIRQRLESYYSETYPIIFENLIHYPNFYVINGGNDADTVFADIQVAIADTGHR